MTCPPALSGARHARPAPLCRPLESPPSVAGAKTAHRTHGERAQMCSELPLGLSTDFPLQRWLRDAEARVSGYVLLAGNASAHERALECQLREAAHDRPELLQIASRRIAHLSIARAYAAWTDGVCSRNRTRWRAPDCCVRPRWVRKPRPFISLLHPLRPLRRASTSMTAKVKDETSATRLPVVRP